MLPLSPTHPNRLLPPTASVRFLQLKVWVEAHVAHAQVTCRYCRGPRRGATSCWWGCTQTTPSRRHGDVTTPSRRCTSARCPCWRAATWTRWSWALPRCVPIEMRACRVPRGVATDTPYRYGVVVLQSTLCIYGRPYGGLTTVCRRRSPRTSSQLLTSASSSRAPSKVLFRALANPARVEFDCFPSPRAAAPVS